MDLQANKKDNIYDLPIVFEVTYGDYLQILKMIERTTKNRDRARKSDSSKRRVLDPQIKVISCPDSIKNLVIEQTMLINPNS